MVEHALKLAELGFKVFPLAPKSKVPQAGTNGFKDASSDPEVIRRMWKKDPNAPIAVATGAMSGVLVVDIDHKTNRAGVLKSGFPYWNILMSDWGPLPLTPTQKTPSGEGRQILFKMPAHPIKSMNDCIEKYIDVKADGGYVVISPSYVVVDNEEYCYKGNYEWLTDQSPFECPLAECPDWLLHLILAKNVQPETEIRTDSDDTLNIADVVKFYPKLRALKPVGKKILVGAHPIHGSTGGKNFRIDLERGVWCCYHHHKLDVAGKEFGNPVGGGSLSLVALMEGIIKCEDKKVSLKGEAFTKTAKVVKEKFGVDILAKGEQTLVFAEKICGARILIYVEELGKTYEYK